MKSLGSMISQLAALLGTRDLTPWEQQFVSRIAGLTEQGRVTTGLSGLQADKIEQLYAKHFGDAERA